MTYEELRKAGADRLTKAGVLEPDLDARYLLEKAFRLSPSSYYLMRREEIKTDNLALWEEMISRREKRIPLQHILGDAEFMGLSFLVSDKVLIPRQDTETLVEEALSLAKKREKGTMRLLDLCTGSGCIAISLAAGGNFLQVVATDISVEALAVARENARRNQVDISFVQSDLFEQLGDESYDLIVSNPPYIPRAEIEHLMPEVKDHDPMLALDGGEDGLVFYRRLAEEAGKHLRHGGALIMEIGWNQAQDVCHLLEENGYQQIRIVKDLAGNDRVVCGIIEQGREIEERICLIV